MFTLAWFGVGFLVPEVFEPHRVATIMLLVVTLYLDVVTWFGGATQFTLAYENRKATEAAEKADANLETALEMLEQAILNEIHTMEFVVSAQKATEAQITRVLEEVRLHHPPE